MSKLKQIFRRPSPYIIGLLALISLVYIGRPLLNSSEVDLARENIFPGRVREVVETKEEQRGAGTRMSTVQTLSVEVQLPDTTRTIEVLNDYTPVSRGTRVLVQGAPNETESSFYVVDIIRRNNLYVLVFLFAITVLVVSGIQGLYSLVGLLFSFVIIFYYVIPRILAGLDPLLVAITGSLAILLVTMYASHGFNRKSLAALIGIALTLSVVSIVAKIGVAALYLTGFGGEEAVYLTQETTNISLADVLIAGIVIAAIGILDDVAVTQASTVFQLRDANGSLSRTQLFKRAMDIGRDHIAAVINTLVMAYAGAALPLMLLLTIRGFPLDFVVNGEVVVEEVARSLISTIGLLLAVPLTTIVAVFFVRKTEKSHLTE